MRFASILAGCLAVVGCGGNPVDMNPDLGSNPMPKPVEGIDGNVGAGDVRVFWDRTSGSAIAMFESLGPDGTHRLYAMHYDGAIWTPPVEIEGEDRDPSALTDGYKVVFLETS